ncbi:MAG: hypothetical protein A2X49_08880 [Lentisphaerae bacterium GWF2_52_8]|nr:MAG: hypothetical protein A2X49_08880 [Lentisphaerae bacterium GWF2_52_8]
MKIKKEQLMKGPKVVLIGAGSVFFARQTIWSMVKKEGLCGGTLALVDTNPDILGTIKKVAQRAIAAVKSPLKLEASTDRKKVLKNADFVILAFANQGVELRNLDAQISKKHGIIMCSADTIGPGGTMRTLREVPRQNAILKDVLKLCPDAWVINWVNPTSAMGIAMMRYFPQIKSLAICDGPHWPHNEKRVCIQAGLGKTSEDITDQMLSHVKIKIGGVNHFNWLFELSYKGKDLLPKVKEALRKDMSDAHHASAEDGKRNLSASISYQLADKLGFAPMCVWHTMEYLPFFQGRDVLKKDALAIKQWNVEVRRKWMKECHDDMAKIASGKRSAEDFLANTGPDHASDIIEGMWCGLRGKRFYINTPNRGAVPNMPHDAFLELPCAVDMNQVSPLPFIPIPRPIHGWLQHVLDEHELAVEAAASCDRNVLRKAFLASMLTQSIPDMEACMEDMLSAEREYLPAAWFK